MPETKVLAKDGKYCLGKRQSRQYSVNRNYRDLFERLHQFPWISLDMDPLINKF